MNTHFSRIALAAVLACTAFPSATQAAQAAQDGTNRRERIAQVLQNQREHRAKVVSEESLGAFSRNLVELRHGGRELLVYVPTHLPPPGQRSMLVALHGGGGNARHMLQHLKMDGVAEREGFIVAYLNGSDATKGKLNRMKAWNAGKGCCGKPHAENVDDIRVITNTVGFLQRKYGIDPARTFGTGHSNGAMMTQTLMCLSDLYPRAVSISGALMADSPTCPAAKGRTLFAYHGNEDQNVPLAGGYGTRGVTDIDFTSAEQSRKLFEAFGGSYVQLVFTGADHRLDHLDEASRRLDGLSLAERIARDLGLGKP